MKKWLLITLATITITMVGIIVTIATNETVYDWVNSSPVTWLAYYTYESGQEELVEPALIDGLLYIWDHPVPKVIFLKYLIDDVLFGFAQENPWQSSFMIVVMMASTMYAWVMQNMVRDARRNIDKSGVALSEIRSRLIRYWVVCALITIITSAITLNFDVNVMTDKWGLRFNGGASLPTSPYLPWQGRLMEYYYHLSIKDFLINNTWSIATIAVVVTMAFWCAIKAHVATNKAIADSDTLMQLLTVPLAAILALLIAVFAPYRVHYTRALKENDHQYDDKITNEAFWTLPIPIGWKMKLEKAYQDSDGVLYLLRDRHASYVQRILRVANKELHINYAPKESSNN
ncbi:hypothetical protein QTV44_002522 [Vibrio vulnificus]|nr:hypothetical protein [Vibrio vulnificus]